MPRLQFLYVSEHCPWRQTVPEREDLVQRCQIERAWNFGMNEKRLYLGRENEAAGGSDIKERPNAHPIAGEEQFAASGIPDGKGPLAIEVIDTAFALFRIHMQNDFGVETGGEPVALFDQFVPEFDIIEDLAVEGNSQRSILAGHRLMA